MGKPVHSSLFEIDSFRKKTKELFVFFIFQIAVFTGFCQVIISPDTTICKGGTATLTATSAGSGYGTNSYSFQLYSYSPEPYIGGTAVTFGSNQDDQIAGPFDIGFSFCFFNQTYTQFYIGTNGWIGFTFNAGWTTFSPDTLPNSGSTVPKNCIMAPWQDWHPGVVHTGFGPPYIFYYSTGIAPNRKLVVYWNGCPMYNCTTTYGTFQIVLNEQNSIIENHLTNKPACNTWLNNRATQGVQNLAGTIAFTAAGRNNSSWITTNESTRFVPDGITWYLGSYPGGTIAGYTSTLNVSPTVTTRYTCAFISCGGAVDTASVVVYVVDPTFNYPSSSFCKSQGTTIPAIVFPGGNFTSIPPGLVFTSTTIGRIDLNASAPGVYSINYSVSSGPITCIGNKSLIIYANPSAPLAVPPSVTRCGPGLVTLNVTVGVHQTAKWYDAVTGGTIYPFTGPTVITTINNTTDFYAETYDSISTCNSLTRAMVHAIMKPVPVITNTIRRDTICSGFSNSFIITSDLPSTTFSWTASCTTGSVTGFAASGNVNTINDFLTNLVSINGIVTYTFTPALNGCSGTPIDFTTVVKPKPVIVLIPSGDTICSGQSFLITYSMNVTGTTISWTASGSSPFVTGYSNGNGTQLTQTLINSDVLPHIVTYTIVPSANGCNGSTMQVVILVNPGPILMVTPLSQQICSGNPTSIALTSSTPASTISWIATSASGNISGFSDGNGSSISQVLSNSGLTTGTVTYKIAAGYNNCISDTVIANVTVNPIANVYFSPVAQTICSGQITNIDLLSNVTGTTFSWTATLSAFITGSSPGNGNHIAQPIVNNGTSPGTITYFVTPTINSCNGMQDEFIENVNPPVNIQYVFCNDTVTTTNAKPFILNGGYPLGGTYSGPGVNSGIFYPSLAGTGTKTIIYSYTNFYSCNNSVSRHVIVSSPVAFSCGSNLTDIRENKIYPTIQIGSQCWMASNLNYGTTILSSYMQRDNCINEKYCYGDLSANCNTYGGLYQWDEVMRFQSSQDVQGLCPPGWHIPDETEWTTLFSNFTSNGFAGSALKSTGFSGFNAFISGIRFKNSIWDFDGFAIFYWSSTPIGNYKAWAHSMNLYNPSVSFYPGSRSNAFPVRCLKD